MDLKWFVAKDGVPSDTVPVAASDIEMIGKLECFLQLSLLTCYTAVKCMALFANGHVPFTTTYDL